MQNPDSQSGLCDDNLTIGVSTRIVNLSRSARNVGFITDFNRKVRP